MIKCPDFVKGITSSAMITNNIIDIIGYFLCIYKDDCKNRL